MTVLTSYSLVFVDELKSCSAVIKAAHPLDDMEGLLAVALDTVLSKLIEVNILMAVGTGLKLQSGKLLKGFSIYRGRFVAFIAVNLLMLTKKPKLCIVVIEFAYRFKGRKIMT